VRAVNIGGSCSRDGYLMFFLELMQCGEVSLCFVAKSRVIVCWTGRQDVLLGTCCLGAWGSGRYVM
jgi:hypothetical protein